MIISLSDVKNLKDSKMYLANGNKEIIDVINNASDRNLTLNLNQFSELSFNLKKQKNMNVFDELKVNQKIYFEKLGWFILGIPSYTHDENNVKTVACKAYSAEYELSQKNLNNFYINCGDYGSIDGVSIYNPDDSSHSLLNLVIKEKFPNWTIGHVDESLKSKQRTFSVESMNVYSFLTEEVAKTLQCIFIFDIENYKINVFDIAHFGTYTDVYLSHNTVIKSLTKSPISEDGITTCIRVTGADDLNIRTVNCGFEYLYDLSYFYSNMSDDLYKSWTNYLTLLDKKSDIFKEKQLQYNEIQRKMDELKNRQPDSVESTNYNEYGIDELNVLLKSVNQSISNYEGKGYNISTSPFYQSYQEYVKKKNEIITSLTTLNTQYSELQCKLETVYDEIVSIKQTVSMAYNFTSEQYLELSSFIKEGDYSDSTFAITDIYTEAQIIQKQYDLKVSATTALSSLAQPQYQIETDIANICKIKAFESNYNKFALGNFIVVYLNENYSIDERLIGIEINLENDSDFKIVFSNSTRSVNGMSDLDYLIDNVTGVSSRSYSNNLSGGSSSSLHANGNEYVTKTELSLAIMNMSIDNSSIFTEAQINTLEKMINGEFSAIDADYIYSKLIEASHAQFDILASHLFTADWITSNKAIFNELLSDYITTTVFNAKIGTIETILSGNIGTGSLQTITLSAANTTLDQTFVNNLLANYITAKAIFGEKISTNEFQIGSDDNTLAISDGTITIKDNNNKTRIQIGKDANGDFCFLLLDSNGIGTIIDQNGVTEHAIADGLIKSDKIADKTNTYSGIGANKLDIDSVITGINDSTTTIKSTKIYFDESEQTLNEKFAEMNTTVNGFDETLDSYGLQIKENSKGIDTLITNTTITKEDGTVAQLKDVYNQTVDTVDKHTQTISSMQSDIDKNESTLNTLQANVSTFTQDLDGFKLEVSKTYTTKDVFESLDIGATNILRNCSLYTTDNKLGITATRDNYFEITNAKVILEKGKQYTFSCKTDGIWDNGTEDTVEAYLLLDGQYQTHFRLDSNEKFTFTAPVSGEYYLRVDVNKNGMTHHFWNFKIEEGNKSTSWSPCPADINTQIEAVSTIANQTANKFNWLVKSGTSESNFTITDRLVELTSEKLEIDALITFMNSAKNGSATVINGSSVTAGELVSSNYSQSDEEHIDEGCKLNLEDGSFNSKYFKWDKYGNATVQNLNATNGTFTGKVTATSGKIGGWNIQENGALRADTGTGTSPGVMNRLYLQPFTEEDYENTWVISSQYYNIDSSGTVSKNGYSYWYITGYGDIYTNGNIRTKGSVRVEENIHANGSVNIDGKLIVMDGIRCNEGFNVASSDKYHMGIYDSGNMMSLKTDIGSLGLHSDAGIHCVNYENTTNVPIYASSFVQKSSLRYKIPQGKMNETDADKLMELDVVKFDYINGEKGQYGLYAEDVSEIIPQCVVFDNKGSPDGIDYSKLVPFLIKELQLQQDRIDKQQKEIDELKVFMNNYINKTNNKQ